MIFKLMMLLGILASLIISGYYFLAYNSLSNLTVYDFYFGFCAVLFFLLSYKFSVEAVSYGEEF